jgi:hypothetical protein
MYKVSTIAVERRDGANEARVSITFDTLPGVVIVVTDGFTCTVQGHGCNVPTRAGTLARWAALKAARE